jgi:hypothetical protein
MNVNSHLGRMPKGCAAPGHPIHANFIAVMNAGAVHLRGPLRITPSLFRRSRLPRRSPAQPIEMRVHLWNPVAVRSVLVFVHCRPSSLVH